jgi:hypothetical protein
MLTFCEAVKWSCLWMTLFVKPEQYLQKVESTFCMLIGQS